MKYPNKAPATWTEAEIRTTANRNRHGLLRILDGAETEQELLAELEEFAPLLIVAPPHEDPTLALQAALTVEHIVVKSTNRALEQHETTPVVDIAVPILCPKRDDRISLALRCAKHRPPFVLALPKLVMDQNHFLQFSTLRQQLESLPFDVSILLLGFDPEQEPSVMQFKCPNIVWEATEDGGF